MNMKESLEKNFVNTNNPIFLFGVPRSGTTLLRLFLDAHSLIAIPFESFIIIDLAKCIHEFNYLRDFEDRRDLVNTLLSSKGISEWSPKVNPSDIDLSKCTSYANTLDQIFNAYARHCGKIIWGDKTPIYVENFHILNELFPYARFIHIIRDGRDVAQSLIKQSWGPTDFLSALKYWKEIITWTRKMGCLLPRNRYIEIRYEDLIVDTENELKKIFKFLNLPYEKSILELFQKDLNKKIPISAQKFHKNLKCPININLVYKWKKSLSLADQALAYKYAGSILDDLKYPCKHNHISKLFLLYREIYHLLRNRFVWRITKQNINIK